MPKKKTDKPETAKTAKAAKPKKAETAEKQSKAEKPAKARNKVKKDEATRLHGKRYGVAVHGIDAAKSYPLHEAVKMVKERARAKFDETIDIAMNLDIDAKQTDQLVRGVVPMPNGIGKAVRVAAFAKDAKADEAKKAGADLIGAEDLVQKILKGEIAFDKCVATPDMMTVVSQVAKILGPRGLMPNPKLGTVTQDLAKAIKTLKSGQVEFKTEKGGVIHAGVGKASFGEKALTENIAALVEAINKAKPEGVKGALIKQAVISSTMGPGVKVDVASILAA